MASPQEQTMTKARTTMRNMSNLPKKKKDRLAEALRKNLHRRKAQARSRAAGAATVGSVTPSHKDMQKKPLGDSSDG
tara:strand:+ start:180 stop:410 length:231 start_codon:yes stop_codon:yes gene_type:complete